MCVGFLVLYTVTYLLPIFQKLIKEIVIWKDHEHPCLLKFFAGCLFDKPKFIVSPYCKNGNALDYLNIHPEADRAKMVCQALPRPLMFKY